MPYLGSWKIDDYLTFPCNTHRPDSGAAADATGSVTYRVYEDETASPIVNGNMAVLDDANTTGFYTERIQLTAANGFEKGKSYTIYIEATVNAVVGTMSHTFQIEAEVDVNTNSDKVNYGLVDDGITASKFDETTAFPVKSEDSGSTEIARWDSLALDHILAGSFGLLITSLINHGFVKRDVTYASGAVVAQGITASMASSNKCKQYIAIKIAVDQDYANPDITYYELFHYDSNEFCDEKKYSNVNTW
jgi:hypothetical protein